MIKIRLPPSDLTSITLYQSALLLLRHAVNVLNSKPEIQKLGKLSPGDLLTCMTMAYEEKFEAASPKYKEPARVEKEAPEKQGVYMKLNKDRFLDELMTSDLIFRLAVISKPNLFANSLRRLLADNDPEFSRLQSLQELTIDDIAKQYKKLLNAKHRSPS